MKWAAHTYQLLLFTALMILGYIYWSEAISNGEGSTTGRILCRISQWGLQLKWKLFNKIQVVFRHLMFNSPEYTIKHHRITLGHSCHYVQSARVHLKNWNNQTMHFYRKNSLGFFAVKKGEFPLFVWSIFTLYRIGFWRKYFTINFYQQHWSCLHWQIFRAKILWGFISTLFPGCCWSYS